MAATHAASTRVRCLALSCVWKNSSRVSCLRSCPEPQGLTGSQVADYGDELHLLAEVNLIYPHLHERIFAARCTPTLQIPQVDRSHRAGRQAELPGHLSYRRAFARQSYGFFETLTKRRFARQLGHLLDLYPALRTAHPVHFDDYRRAKFAPRQVAHFPFIVIMRVGKLSSAPRTDQLAVSALAPYP